MSKKLVFLVSIVTVSAILAGCSTVLKDNTMKAIKLTPKVEGATMVAELEVANKKVMGHAKGKSPFKDNLEKEATAEALKLADSDVLVGANFFYEYVGNADLTVTVVGYPARYKNFKPKEAPERKEGILVDGVFFYKDISNNNNNMSALKPAAAAPAPTVQGPVNVEKTIESSAE
jgi:hypothetical protein